MKKRLGLAHLKKNTETKMLLPSQLFFLMGQSRPLFVYFRLFPHDTIQI